MFISTYFFFTLKLGDDEDSWAFDGYRLLVRWNRVHKTWGKKPWKEGDVIGCYLNLDDFEMQFSINGKLLRDTSGDSLAFRDFRHFIGEGVY